MRAADAGPGRSCPTAYRYPPRSLDRAPELEADTLLVVGGLYGNVEALAEVLAMAAREPGPVAIAFNGDFHWFDTAADDFRRRTMMLTCTASLCGLPQLNVPAGEVDGCPVGLSLLGWPGGDEALLDLALRLAS